MISTLRTQRGDMTSCWKESARLLLETLLPDDNVEDDEEQETAKIDMTRNCDSKTETDPITREEMTRSKVVVLAGGKWNKISGRVPPQGVALTGARTNPGTIRFGSGGTPSGAGYCASSTPTQVATRFVFIITTLLAVIVFTAYSSNLISFLTVRKNVFTIKSIDEMFKKNSSYRVGVVKRSSEFDLLQDSDVPDILKIRKGALKCEKRYLMEIPNVEIHDNMTEALNEVCNSQFALVIMSDYLKAQKTQQQCEMVPLEGFLYTTELSFGLRERSSFQEYFRYQ
uniref:Ionotropic glutamate receptor C-terminal domain-containing protein n=1 Tax=Timema poppense TaxID=170557 RepID=A0A7R9DM58_TIMPO|nr:unnamed protein product [Timema poppensis]